MRPSKLPFDGIHRSAEKRRAATVVFIHHFGGHRNSSRKHQDFVLSLGFDTVSFNLTHCAKLSEAMKGNAFLPDLWAEELKQVLDAVEGPKILYSFSFPSAAALWLIGRGREDVKGWICDGGPFLKLFLCLWNYFTYQEPFSVAKRLFVTILSFQKTGGFQLKRRIDELIANFPPGFPVFSVRAEKDRLVPPQAIAAVLDRRPNIELTVLQLEGIGHLEGFWKRPKIYKEAIAAFLDQI